jgi:Arc/MetJ-type ribon-helix-helix transcriptional regulator
MPAVRYSFTLDAIQDAALIRWLEMQPNASAAVREALREHLDQPTRAQLDAKLDRVLDALRNVQVVQGSACGDALESAEPAAARRGLDAMKARFRGT